MKFQCKKADILHPLQEAQSIVQPRTALQILSNVLIEATDQQIYMTTTDYDLTLLSRSTVDVETPGKTTIPAKKLFDIIKSLPDDTLEIEVDEQHLVKISCKKSLYRIYGLPPSDFPKLSDFGGATILEFPQKLLKDMIRSTSFAISRDDSRYVLNGICFKFQANTLTVVATDGRRLALYKDTEGSYGDEPIEFIIPTKAISELQKLMTEEGNVKLEYKNNQVRFNMGLFQFTTKLVDGRFPEYDAVIPKSTKQAIKLNRDEFTQAISRVSILTSEKSNSVRIQFDAGKATITANTPNVGEAKEELDIDFNGESLVIAFNPAYLLDVLKALDKKEVILETNGAQSPGVFRNGTQFLSVIMPMRVAE